MKRDVLWHVRKLADDIRKDLAARECGSMCELSFTSHGTRIDDYYEVIYEKLLAKLEPHHLQFAKWQIGTVLLLLMSERARREAKGHALWRCIAEWLPTNLRGELFAEDVPQECLKAMIRAAVQRLNLRHAFGDAAVRQPYYTTIHLQFGWTRDAVEHRLPGWLAGENRPIAVRRLLAGPQASATFRRLWDALKHFRHDYISEAELRDVLRDNPWVLDEWHDLLVDVVQGSRTENAPRQTADEPLDDDAFFVSPELVWDASDGPAFVCRWIPSGYALPSSEYSHVDVQVGNVPIGRAVRRSDGRFYLHSDEIRFSGDTSPQVVSLVEPDGDVVAVQTLHLWQADQEVAVFQLKRNGRLTPFRSKMSSDSSYVVWTFGELRVRPEPALWFRGGTEELPWTASFIESPWDADQLRVETAEGDVVWRPRTVDQEGSRDGIPEDRVHVTVRGRERVVVGDRLSLAVRGLPSEARIVSARFNNRAVRIDGKVISGVGIVPSDVWRRPHLRLQVEVAGNVTNLRTRCDMPLEGAVYQASDSWHACREDEVLSVGCCRRRLFRIVTHGAERPIVCEGSLFVRNVGLRSHPLTEVTGTGAPLAVRAALLNAPEELLRIAAGVVDQGIVTGVGSTHAGWHLTLAAPLDPTPEHAVVCWPCSGEAAPTVIGTEQLEAADNGSSWEARCPVCRGQATSMVAIRFRREWLGGALHGRWEDLFARLDDLPAPPAQIARHVDWFRLPVLLSTSGTAPLFAPFAGRHAASVLSAWLRPPERLDDAALSTTRGSDAARTGEIVRWLFANWTPNDDAVAQLCAAMGTATPEDSIGDVFVATAPYDPVLAGKLARHWFGGQPPAVRRSITVRLASWYHRLFGSIPDWMTSGTKAATSAYSGHAQIDPYFAEHLAGEAIRSLEGNRLENRSRFNLHAALHIHSFREFLVRRIVEHLQVECADR